MTAAAIPRPAAAEYDPYYGRYIDKVPEGDLLRTLEDQARETQRLLAGLSDAKALHRYAAGKWSIKEVIGHVADTERVYAYRALRFARADATALPGFDENAWVPAGSFDARSCGPGGRARRGAARHPRTVPWPRRRRAVAPRDGERRRGLRARHRLDH